MYSSLDSSKKEIRLIELLPAFSTRSKITFRLCTACLSIATAAEFEACRARGDIRAFGPCRPVLVARATGLDGSYESGQVLEYEALSYTWGVSKKSREICYRSGRSERSVVPVTDNLFNALRGLRPRRGRPMLLWIDALCINQSDLAERSAQVRFMPEIYRWAETVNVWLGDATGISLLIKAIHVFAWGSRDACYTPPQFSPPGRWSLGHLRQWTLRHAFVCALSSTQPAWTGRAWCVQEYVVASRKRLLSGRASLNPPAWSLESHSAEGIPVSWRDREEVIALELHLSFLAGLVEQQRWSGGCSLDDGSVMSIIDQTDCTDPRDKLYAVLGLLPESQSSKLSIDYQSPVWKVYAQATYAAIISSCTLSVMQLCREAWAQTDATIPSLPSWAVNLTRPPEVPRAHKLLNQSQALDLQMEELVHLNFAFTARAALTDSPRGDWCSISQDLRHLRLRCSRLAVLTHVVTFETDVYLGAESIYGLDMTPWQRLLDTVSTDELDSMQTHVEADTTGVIELPPIASSQDAISQLQHRTLHAFTNHGPKEHAHATFAATYDDPNSSRHYIGYLSYAIRSTGGSLAFTTNNNYLGWCPNNAEPGDCLAMIPNCTLPIVIRRAGESWRFLGFAYLHHLTVGVSSDAEGGLHSAVHFQTYWDMLAEAGEEIWLC